MTNTALRAENSNSRTITFKSREHEKFYEEYLKKCRYQDVYHRALAPNKDAFCITKCVSCQFPSEIGSQDDSRETSIHSQKDVK